MFVLLFQEGKMEPCEMAYPKSFPAKLIDLPAEKVCDSLFYIFGFCSMYNTTR